MASAIKPIPEGYVRLWTIQSEAAWESAQKKGSLAGGGRRVWSRYRPAYRWMMAQMAKYIPRYKGMYPVWAFASFKPDLRKKGWASVGYAMVRMEFIAPREQVLFSVIDAFSIILLNAFISWTEAEDDEFELAFPETNSAARQERIENSWERAFDLDPWASGADPNWNGNDPWIQATLEKIPLSWVIEVTAFIS
jgi:hypothetical protein